MIQNMYLDNQTKLLVNSQLTQAFPLAKGTKQSYPLSPLLFSIVLEPLLNCIRVDRNIPHIKYRTLRLKPAVMLMTN
uniref:Reverse transcriptase domain-containing protein n=1 Tax=Salvator merianae TaxID=96440 RepID=A0A8D0E984_SALMN